MIDARDEKEFYVEVKFIKYGTYTIHATSKEHAMQKYNDGSWSDYAEEYSLSFEEEIELHDSALGIWDTSDEDELIEQITELSGWCIKSIDYEIIKDSSTLNNINGATL